MSINIRLDKLWCIHTMEFLLHSDLKKELLVYATTQVNFTVKMMSERSQTQKAIWFHPYTIQGQTKLIYGQRSEKCLIWGSGRRLTGNRHKSTLQSIGNIISRSQWWPQGDIRISIDGYRCGYRYRCRHRVCFMVMQPGESEGPCTWGLMLCVWSAS